MKIHEIIKEDWQSVNKKDKTDGMSNLEEKYEFINKENIKMENI